MHVVRPRHWLAVLTFAGLIGAALTWAITARLPIMVVGCGVLMRPRQVGDVQVPASGRLHLLRVRTGVRVGMPMQIIPDTVERERFGSIVGTVTSVSAFAVSREGMGSLVGNDKVVKRLMAQGPQLEVVAALAADPATVSGYQWSSSRGPDVLISSGTTASGRVAVEQRAPITYVMEPGPTFTRGGRRPRLLPALWARLRGFTQALLLCARVGLLLAIPRLAIPAFSQIFVDQILIQGLQDWLRPLLVGMVLTAGLSGALLRMQLYYLRRLKVKLAGSMSSRFIWHLLHVPAAYERSWG